jgi:hypothetical protein
MACHWVFCFIYYIAYWLFPNSISNITRYNDGELSYGWNFIEVIKHKLVDKELKGGNENGFIRMGFTAGV